MDPKALWVSWWWFLPRWLTIFRFAKEYSASPHRGYGAGVIQVLKKLSSPQLNDVYQPARDQFNGRGSFGNGGAMRAAPFALAFPDLSDVKGVSRGLLNVEFSLSNGSDRNNIFKFALFLCSLPIWAPCWRTPALWVIMGRCCKR